MSSSGSPIPADAALAEIERIATVIPAAQTGAGSFSLRSLIHHRESVDQELELELVHRSFNERQVDFLALTHLGRVTGVCSRLRLGFMLGSRFGFSLYSRSPARQAQVPNPLIFDESLPTHQVLDRALARRDEEFHEDVVLIDAHGVLLGLIPVDALARLQSQLVTQQVEELRRRALDLFQANHALRQSRGLYSSLFESHSLGVALLDVQGGVHEHNHRLAELVNFPAGETRPSLLERLAPADRRGFTELLELHARGAPATATREFTLSVPSRGSRNFRCTFGWVRETGQICVCLDDVTEQRELERRLLKQEKQSLLDTLVGGVAHELNNKLTPVMGFAELVRQSKEDSIRLYGDLMVKSVTEAAAIIRQLLQLSKPSAAELRSLDLRSILEEALVMLRFQLRESQVTVRTTLPPTPVMVRADGSQLKQVVFNLVINALQALGKQPTGVLEVGVWTEAGSGQVRVIDNGPGIPPENLERIFDPFFTTKGPDKGTGLGLSVCSSIVRQHGGEISVHSRLGAGATFVVSLPLQSDSASVSASPVPRFETEPARPLTRHRVLVADDEIVIRRLLQEILAGRFGCRVDVVADGFEALERLASGTYSLLISDVRMPGMSGTELFQKLRQTQPELTERMIFITGHPGEKALQTELEQSGVPVVLKPFSVGDLVAACEPFLRDHPVPAER
jgi:signal transduction histidine kinase